MKLKRMKVRPLRIFAALLLLLAMLLAITGCGSDPYYDDNESSGGWSETVPDDTGDAAQPDAADPSDAGDTASDADTADTPQIVPAAELDPDGVYDSKDAVALYLHLYGKLPSNYITKNEAQDLGWSGGSLEPYAPGKCIGGSRFGNYEGLLPDAEGRTWKECDIDTLGADSRGPKRLVYSNDGLIYYTDDHYASFELLYGPSD